MRLTLNVYPPPQLVRCYTQSLKYGVYSQGIFPKVNWTTTDHLFYTLLQEDERHNHVVLSHKGMGTRQARSRNFKRCCFPHCYSRGLHFLSHQMKESYEWRPLWPPIAIQGTRSQKIVMCIAIIWMTAAERSMFHKFPSMLVKIDLTFKTNLPGFFFGKTSDSDIFTVLRCLALAK
jgi:hypothetical protein